jgi:hypothetical protein
MLRLLRPSYRFASRYITQAHTLPKIYDTRLENESTQGNNEASRNFDNFAGMRLIFLVC